MNIINQHKERIESIIKEKIENTAQGYESNTFSLSYNQNTNEILCKSKNKIVSNVRINLNKEVA